LLLTFFKNVLIMSKDIILVTSGNEPDVKKTIRGQTTRNWGANSGVSPVDWTYSRTVRSLSRRNLCHY